MREPSIMDQLQHYHAESNPYLPKPIHDTRIHEALEEFRRRDSAYILPRHADAAVEAVNMINTYGTMQTGQQYGFRILPETIEQLTNVPIPEPESRNWYREYLYPWTRPDSYPMQGQVDPVGDLIRMDKWLTSTEAASRWQAEQDHLQSILEDMLQPGKSKNAARGVRGRWQS